MSHFRAISISRLEEVGGASDEGEEASMVGRLIGLFGVSSSSLGADLLRTLGGGGEKEISEHIKILRRKSSWECMAFQKVQHIPLQNIF